MSAEKSASPPHAPTELAAVLRERVYITFTAVAVITVLRKHGEDAWSSARTLFLMVAGSVVAGFLADVLAHVIAHQRHLTKEERWHVLAVAAGGLFVIAIPLAVMSLSHWGVMSVERALDVALVLLACSLGAMAYLAYRHLKMPWWKRLQSLAVFVIAALAVIGIEQLAHV